MKNTLKNFAHFSRAERKGIVALLAVSIIVICINATMVYWVTPNENKADPKLAAAIDKYIAEHAVQNKNSNYYSNNEASLTGELFAFDPNILDSLDFIRLGLRPVTIHMLLNWRRKGKIFYKKEDLKTLYTLKEEEYNRLAPYIHINSVSPFDNNFSSFPKEAPLPAHIDLNTTDSGTLVRLRGIGPTLAHKIIAKRNVLGGFVSHKQLIEIYQFPDTVFSMLKEKLIINKKVVRTYNLNTVSLHELSTHPYINEKMAKNIIMFREGLKGFSNIEQLRQVPLMNEEIYRKIAPYFVIE